MTPYETEMCREVSGNSTDTFILYPQPYRHTVYLSNLSVGTHTHRERWEQNQEQKAIPGGEEEEGADAEEFSLQHSLG